MIKQLGNGKGQLRLVSKRSLPVWSIVHYMNRLSIRYLKLLTIERVCEALSQGCLDQDLIVAEESAKLISNRPFSYDQTKSYKQLLNKGEDYKLFWKIIGRHHRPIVLRRVDNGFYPLISIENDDLIINRLSVSSPPDITVSGIGNTLTDLYYAREREQRLRDAHQNEQIGQATRNIGEIASAQALLSNSDLNSGVKTYLENMILNLVNKQDALNREMGLISTEVDETA